MILNSTWIWNKAKNTEVMNWTVTFVIISHIFSPLPINFRNKLQNIFFGFLAVIFFNISSFIENMKTLFVKKDFSTETLLLQDTNNLSFDVILLILNLLEFCELVQDLEMKWINIVIKCIVTKYDVLYFMIRQYFVNIYNVICIVIY